jgi:hypothetical protein
MRAYDGIGDYAASDDVAHDDVAPNPSSHEIISANGTRDAPDVPLVFRHQTSKEIRS